jgi:hypothetical protein
MGVNSQGPGYTAEDRAAAIEVRDRMIEKYPEIMDTTHPSRIPNNALFHAEATVMLRAARDNGGSLPGREFDLHVDRRTCDMSCMEVLPYLTRELGYPTVRIFDGSGRDLTIRNGNWTVPR